MIVDGQTSRTITYSIPARTSQKWKATGGAFASRPSPNFILTGSIRVIPSNGTATPNGVAIFSFENNGVTTTEASTLLSAAGTAFRLYAESTGDGTSIGSIQTGVAVANAWATSATTVTFELENLDGSFAGPTAPISIPPNGQVAVFLNQLPGFSSLPSFQKVLRVSSASSISLAGLRGRYNERGDFLITTTPPTNENVMPSGAPLFFPHIVDSGGYTTQFIIFSGVLGNTSSGVLELFSSAGAPMNIAFQ